MDYSPVCKTGFMWVQVPSSSPSINRDIIMIKKASRGFWQVSDEVAKSTVDACVKGCDNKGCNISFRVLHTTCAGISASYNKEGMLVIDDRNKRTTYGCCSNCHKEWEIEQTGDEVTKVTELDPEF
jgi:hypothetical protein